MSRKTKASKKRLNDLLLILLLTAVLLIMSTYAWFTANRTVRIDSIDVEVATSSGLQISANGKDWKMIIDKQNILDAYQDYEVTPVNQLPALMAPVSSALELDNSGHIKMFYGKVEAVDDEDQYLLTSTLQTDVESSTVSEDDLKANEYAKGYYMAFDVYLKVEADAENLYMSGTVEEPVDVGETKKGLENAARVALVKCVDDEIEATDATLSNIQGISTAGGKVFMWEPNADVHTQNGVNNAIQLGWFAAGGLGLADNDPIAYSGIKQEFEDVELERALASDDDYGSNFTVIQDNTDTDNTIWQTDAGEVPSFEIGGLKAGISKLRVYFWIEGQDIDCENNASGTDVQFALKFSLDPISGNAEPEPDPDLGG